MVRIGEALRHESRPYLSYHGGGWRFPGPQPVTLAYQDHLPHMSVNTGPDSEILVAVPSGPCLLFVAYSNPRLLRGFTVQFSGVIP